MSLYIKDDCISGTKVTDESVTMAIQPGCFLGVSVRHDDTTPTGGTFTAVVATDLITLSTHAMATGLKVQATTTGALPGGLAVSTDYFVIAVGSSTLKLAASLTDALAGKAIDITTTGTGTHTLTPVSGGTRSFALSFSVDGENFSNVVTIPKADALTLADLTVAAVTISVSAATKLYSFNNLQGIRFVKLSLTMADGQASISATMCAAK